MRRGDGRRHLGEQRLSGWQGKEVRVLAVGRSLPLVATNLVSEDPLWPSTPFRAVEVRQCGQEQDKLALSRTSLSANRRYDEAVGHVYGPWWRAAVRDRAATGGYPGGVGEWVP